MWWICGSYNKVKKKKTRLRNKQSIVKKKGNE